MIGNSTALIRHAVFNKEKTIIFKTEHLAFEKWKHWVVIFKTKSSMTKENIDLLRIGSIISLNVMVKYYLV